MKANAVCTSEVEFGAFYVPEYQWSNTSHFPFTTSFRNGLLLFVKLRAGPYCITNDTFPGKPLLLLRSELIMIFVSSRNYYNLHRSKNTDSWYDTSPDKPPLLFGYSENIHGRKIE